MTQKSILLALVTGGLLLATSPVLAQDNFSGAVKGVVSDQANGNPVAGATVVISGPNLQGTQVEITDASGSYRIGNVPPGTYLITVYYANAQFERSNVLVRLGKTALINVKIDLNAGQGEIIPIEGRAPLIDQGSTKTGRTITPDYTQNIPTGRTFGEVLGAAAGSQDDLYGVSFGGSTSAENTYIVEGLNTTDPAYGVSSTDLPNEFIQETEVITGGYNAEYGRATGAVINVVTKSGSNEFHGSVFSRYTPGQLVAAELETPRADSSINHEPELGYRWDVGAELGGPIIKDKLWFHVGFSPSFRNTKFHRLIKSRVDANDDGVPDANANGFLVTNEVDRTTRDIDRRWMYFTAKLTGAVTPNHQGSISFLGNPETADTYIDTRPGVDAGQSVKDEEGSIDISGKWTSKFLNNKVQVDAVVGYHSQVDRRKAREPGGNDFMLLHLSDRKLEDFSTFEERDYGSVPAACIDGSENDPFKSIENCPVNFYNVGGLGFRENEDTTRLTGQISATARFNLAGHHSIKAGVDFEDNRYDHFREYTSGRRYLDQGITLVDRWFKILEPEDLDRIGQMTEDGVEIEGCDIGLDIDVPCRHLPGGQFATTNTRNYSAFIQDSWAILPNLTLNAGLRWEQQSLLIADEIKNSFDWDSMSTIENEAMKISDMFAPRLGIIYDPTQEGRSKLSAHYGRFYESIPMDINSRAFGGEVVVRRFLTPVSCESNFDPSNYTCTEKPVTDPNNPNEPGTFRTRIFGGGTEKVVPGIGGQYLDEWAIGGEYELLDDFKVGISYIHRSLGRVIEDISIDGGTTYVIANPGEVDEAAVQAEFEAGKIDERTRDNLLAAADYDTPTRAYDAVVLTAEKRFSRNLMVQASYTYSRLEGNFPGLFSPETGQLDPNLTSMFDLPELMANRTGRLAADRPHNFKLAGYYRLDARELGQFVFGANVRAVSGIPHNVLGRHIDYGARESYLLPRAIAPRSPFTTKFDIQVAYGRQLAKNTRIEAYLQVYNVFNQQPGIDTDEEYTDDILNPIVGGDQSDLDHAKELIDRATGSVMLNNTVAKNPNFGNINERQNPLEMTFGMRLIF
ncbi:MAG: TonB-dependent receptor [Proteobacteria bacterium]|nr:TonB-dependent receptor [Pseudomonadota bacterium]